MTEIKEEDEDDGLPQRLSLHSLVGHSSRRNEKKVNANRVTILKKLQENNEKYIEFLETHTKDGHDEPQKSAELQRDYAKNFTDLESQDDLWAKDSDPFEGLREAVGQRHDLLEAIVENANRCVQEAQTERPIEHLREESEGLAAKLDRLNNTITSLELRCCAEKEAAKTLTEFFNEYASNFWSQADEKDKLEDGMTKHNFKKFWAQNLGCKLEGRKFSKFQKEMAKNSETEGELKPNEINAELFSSFLRLQYGITPDEANFLIRVNAFQDEYQKRENFKCARACLFIILWFFILILIYLQLGSSKRYWQTLGAKQMFEGSVWDDKQFGDINSVGTVWQFMEAVVMPFAYGYLEFGHEIQDLEDYAEIRSGWNKTVFDAPRVNPYILGGFRLRTSRYKTTDCESPLRNRVGSVDYKDVYKCQSDDFETKTWDRFVDISPINEPLKHNSRSELDEQKLDIGEIRSNYEGSGYYVDFPPLSTLANCNEYSGGDCSHCTDTGISEEAPYELCKSMFKLRALRNNFFIDGRTDAVFLDMNLFSPSSGLHTLVRLLFEFRYGVVAPSSDIQTWNLLLYEDKQKLIWIILFTIMVVFFTSIHIHQCFKHMNVLGYPICCQYYWGDEKTRQQAKLPPRLHRYQLEKVDEKDESDETDNQKRGEIEFMNWDNEKNTLSISIDNLNTLRVQQKQDTIRLAVKEVLQEKYSGNDKLKIGRRSELRQTGWGGAVLTIHIFSTDIDDKKIINDKKVSDMFTENDVFAHIAEAIEKSFFVLREEGFDEVNILVLGEPGILERIFGFGLKAYYFQLWNSMDLILVFFFWLYIILHLSKVPNLNLKELISHHADSTYVSLRDINEALNFEVNTLFFVTFFSCFRLVEFFIQVNKQVRLFSKMIVSVFKVIMSFFLLIFFMILTFAISGWVTFSSEIHEFRSPMYSLINLFRWTVSELPYEELVAASNIGILYYLFWIFIMSLILINVFLAIVLNGWEIIKQESENEKSAGSWFPMLNRLMGWTAENKNPKTDWLKGSAQWRQVYPAGCPDHRLKDYLKNQMDLDEGDCEEVLQIIDIDSSGSIRWEELTSILLDLKPNLENRTFAMRRKQTQQIMESQSRIQQDLYDLSETFEKRWKEDHLKLLQTVKRVEEIKKK